MENLENHIHALALHFGFNNLFHIHKSLRVILAMAASVADWLWTLENSVAKINAMAPAPNPRLPCKKRNA